MIKKQVYVELLNRSFVNSRKTTHNCQTFIKETKQKGERL